jgi:hypothetical protein
VNGPQSYRYHPSGPAPTGSEDGQIQEEHAERSEGAFALSSEPGTAQSCEVTVARMLLWPPDRRRAFACHGLWAGTARFSMPNVQTDSRKKPYVSTAYVCTREANQ